MLSQMANMEAEIQATSTVNEVTVIFLSENIFNNYFDILET
jgi:hypothetical protein